MSDRILSPKDFGLKIYNHFPPQYRVDDEQTNFSLMRYLQALSDGGFAYNIEELNGILEFANPDMATPQALPILFKQYGLDIFNGIPEQFLRYLLPRIGEAWSKKGSLDVVEFVVSSLTGIKTRTDITNFPNGDTDLTIRLEMDYAMSDYFPNAKQFLRIIDKFLPFYLGRYIIYVYVFYEKQEVHLSEKYWLDKVKLSLHDEGCIAHSILLPTRALNNPNRLLNDTLYTNGFELLPYPPDWFKDAVTYYSYDTGVLDSKWSHDYYDYSLWNVHKLNKDLYTNRHMRTDSFLDKVKLRQNEEQEVEGKDSRKDHLVIGEHVYYFPALNSNLHLNDGLVTNKSDVDIGEIEAVDTEGTYSLSVCVTEPGCIDKELAKDQYNFSKWNISLLNQDLYTSRYMRTDDHEETINVKNEEVSNVKIGDTTKDRLDIGSKVLYLPTLNTDLRTNSDFCTNRSDVDLAEVITEDTGLDCVSLKSVNERVGIDAEVSHEYYEFSLLNITPLNSGMTTSRYMRTDDQKDHITTTYPDNGIFECQETKEDHVTIDSKVSYLPALNTNLRLNEGFHTNGYSNVDVIILKSEDTPSDHPRTLTSDSISVSVLPSLITNLTSSRTNYSTIGLPDCFDRITYKNGSVEYRFV